MQAAAAARDSRLALPESAGVDSDWSSRGLAMAMAVEVGVSCCDGGGWWRRRVGGSCARSFFFFSFRRFYFCWFGLGGEVTKRGGRWRTCNRGRWNPMDGYYGTASDPLGLGSWKKQGAVTSSSHTNSHMRLKLLLLSLGSFSNSFCLVFSLFRSPRYGIYLINTGSKILNLLFNSIYLLFNILLLYLFIN